MTPEPVGFVAIVITWDDVTNRFTEVRNRATMDLLPNFLTWCAREGYIVTKSEVDYVVGEPDPCLFVRAVKMP